MKNADMPAMPTRDAIEDCGPDGSQGPHMVEISYGGLTKREHFAAMAMQGLLAGGYCIDDARDRMNDVPSEAINLADALLADLERTS